MRHQMFAHLFFVFLFYYFRSLVTFHFIFCSSSSIHLAGASAARANNDMNLLLCLHFASALQAFERIKHLFAAPRCDRTIHQVERADRFDGEIDSGEDER